MTTSRLTRRDFLRLGAAVGCGVALAGCTDDSTTPTDPSNPGTYGLRGFNVHPYQGALYAHQLKALQSIHANWTRTTLGIPNDIAGPYASMSGMNVLGLIGDFQMSSIPKSDWPDMVESVIRRYPAIRYFQVLNEPEVFYNMSNTEYVRDYLRPAHDRIRRKFPAVKIVSAAPIGQPSGMQHFALMSAYGADEYCDFRAVHIYFEQDTFTRWSTFRAATQKPIMITETGARQPEKHLTWWQTQIPTMKRALNTEYVFYYALLEQPQYTGFEIITTDRDSAGNIIPAPNSQLYHALM